MKNMDPYIYTGQRVKSSIQSQGSKGIRQWPINRCTSPMMTLKIIPSVETVSG